MPHYVLQLGIKRDALLELKKHQEYQRPNLRPNLNTSEEAAATRGRSPEATSEKQRKEKDLGKLCSICEKP